MVFLGSLLYLLTCVTYFTISVSLALLCAYTRQNWQNGKIAAKGTFFTRQNSGKIAAKRGRADDGIVESAPSMCLGTVFRGFCMRRGRRRHYRHHLRGQVVGYGLKITGNQQLGPLHAG